MIGMLKTPLLYDIMKCLLKERPVDSKEQYGHSFIFREFDGKNRLGHKEVTFYIRCEKRYNPIFDS